MKSTMRKTALGAVTAGLAAGLLWSAAAAAAKVELTIAGAAEDLYADQWAQVNPDVSLKVISDSYEQLALMSAAGTPPDLIRVSAEDIPRYVNEGLLEDLTPYLKTATTFKASDLMPVNDLYKSDGKLYAINKDWSVDNLLWYNKDILNRVGLAAPSLTQSISYDDVMQMSKKIDGLNDPNKERTIFGWYSDNYPELFQASAAATGEPLYTADYLHTTLMTNPGIKDVASWWYEMFSRGWGTGSHSYFYDGNAGMTFLGYYYGGHPQSEPLRKLGILGVAPVPAWHGNVAAYSYAVGYGIAKGSKHKAEAFKYLEWMTTGKPAELRTAQGWGAPPVRRLINRLPQDTPLNRQRFQVLLDMSSKIKQLPPNPYSMSAIADASTQPRLKAQRGEISLDEFLRTWSFDTDQALAKAAGK